MKRNPSQKKQKLPPAKRGRKPGRKLPPPTLSATAIIVRPNQLNLLLGISRSTAYRLESLGLFPKRRQLSTFAVGWIRSELDYWLASRQSVTREA